MLYFQDLKGINGIPYIANYTKIDYSAAGQNWSVSTSKEGNVYFANSKGLLCYNGNQWQLLPISEKKHVRSVMCNPLDGRIYIGSFEEFGYFEKDIYGVFNYKSLSKSIQNYTFHNDEIWSIVICDNKIYFRSFSSYFVYDGENIKAIQSPEVIVFFKNWNEKLYAYHQNVGLSILNNDQFELILPSAKLNRDNAVGILPYNHNTYIIPTIKNGLFVFNGKDCLPWKNEVNEELKNANINQVEITKDTCYIIGTILNGVYAINRSGKLIWHINSVTGLQNNTILGVACDNENDLWLGLDNGVSFIKNNSRIRFLNSFNRDIGSVYSALFKDDYLYLATNQGLFFCPSNGQDNNIQLIPHMSEQAWDLSLIDNQLICGHNLGTFDIIGKNAFLLSGTRGATSIRKATINNQEILVQSTYTYLNIYRKNALGKWEFSHVVDDFMQPVRYIEVDAQGNIWASHFYKGLYKIRLSKDLRHAEEVSFYYPLDSENPRGNINVFMVKGRIVFSDGKKLYTYDDQKESIVSYQYIENLDAELKDIIRMIPVDNDIYWIICSSEFILADIKGKTVKIKQRIPFSGLYGSLPDNNESVIPLNGGKSIFCLDNGIAIGYEPYNSTLFKTEKKIIIEKIQASGQSGVMLLPLKNINPKQISHKWNNLYFQVAYPYDPGENARYQYKLSGLDEDLTELISESFRKYDRLSPGSYTLEVSALDNLGNKLSTQTYSFEIEPPFYASNAAFILYILLGMCILAFGYLYVKRHIVRRVEKIKRQQDKLRQEENEKREKEIIRLKNEKLEDELTFKSKELASSTISIIKKNEVLLEIKEELSVQKEKLGTQFPNKYYDKLVRLIDTNLSSEDDWSIFQTNFDRIHENFFRNLKASYPELTPNDLKLCALLRLNMNTKDIANLMSITVRGVEVARYRLRKKINLPSHKNLVEFLIEFK